MPQVQRHEQVESWFYSMGRAYLAKRPRRGIHVSDLLTPRKAYWARVMPKPPSDREVLYFLAGRAHEEFFVALGNLGRHHKVRGEWLGVEADRYAEGDGVEYEMDAVMPTDGGPDVPTEVKTNRRPKVPEPGEVIRDYEQAVAQLARYVAIRNEQDASIRTGYLIEFHLMARNLVLREEAAEGEESDATGQPDEADPQAWLRHSQPTLVVYQIDWTDAELEAIRQDMATGRRLLEAAVESKDHTILPECPAFMCGREHRRVSDPRCPKCGTVYDNRRLRKCKQCKADLVRDEDVTFVAGCRWFGVCGPPQWSQYHTNYFRPRRGDEVPV